MHWLRAVIVCGVVVVGCRAAPMTHQAGHDVCRLGQRPAGLVLAGSGVSLAPLRTVVAAWRDAHLETQVHLAASIGTGGSIRALLDGAIDIGLAARSLTASEEARGIDAVDLARVPLAFVVHRDTPVEDITSSAISAIYSGEVASWPDGTPIAPLIRQPSDSTSQVLARHDGRLAHAMQKARDEGRALVYHTDQQMRDVLLTLPGAIGLLDVGTINLEGLPLRPLRYNGISPTASALAAGTYPMGVVVSLLTRSNPTQPVRDFVAFAVAASERDLIAAEYLLAAPPTDGPH